ncbi:MAG TPA: DUF2330 domain-containing protein [Ktedonobacterales bacterium]|nr:DUF2330 domain-containing protein [Ktedonobacterales bacterium]
MRMALKALSPVVVALGLLFMQTLPAAACGGLVAPDGDVRLARATTFVAWHGGVEHYMTSFSYTGNEPDVGWIVPLPAVPTAIQDGGRWTLQRLFLESHPQPPRAIGFGAASETASAAPSIVVEQAQVEALKVTILNGSGQAVLDWCAQKGFYLSGDTRDHLLKYAQGSPIFMAAKYDTSAAQARHQQEGDGVPLLLTMSVPHPWVPLEVLALDGQQVQADIYFLTDQPLNTSDWGAAIGQSSVGTAIPGATGFKVAFQERMTSQLYQDLSSDRNMGWIWQDSWLTYLTLDAPDAAVTYDMGITSSGVIRLAPFGTAPMAIGAHDGVPSWVPRLPVGAPELGLALILILALAAAFIVPLRLARRLTARGQAPAVSVTGESPAGDVGHE